MKKDIIIDRLTRALDAVKKLPDDMSVLDVTALSSYGETANVIVGDGLEEYAKMSGLACKRFCGKDKYDYIFAFDDNGTLLEQIVEKEIMQ